jgi:electron transport complex protein RnfG
MAKLESSFKNMLLVLTGITMFSAITLGAMYTLTKDPIEASKVAKQENAIKMVLPPFERIADVEEVTIDGLGVFKMFKAYDKDDQFVGAAIESFSKNGFSGEIKVMVGFDINGNIVDYSVLEQKETPGLGTKMVDWFKTVKGKQNIKSKNAGTANLTVSKDGGDIDAITAATISSRAFLEAVRAAYKVYAENPDAPDEVTGATEIENQNDSTELETSN